MASRPTERARQYALTRFAELALEGSSRRDLQLRSTSLIAEALRGPKTIVDFYEVDDHGTFVFVGSNDGDTSSATQTLPPDYESLCRAALAADRAEQMSDSTGHVAAVTTHANHGSRGLHLLRRNDTGKPTEDNPTPEGTFSDDELTFVQTLGRLIAMASERQLAERRNRQLHLHDPLTGLPNQQLFFDRLEVALERTARTTTETGALIIDIDHFDMVNATLGRAAGDRLLTAAGERLRDALRPGDMIARFNGDTFLVLCEELRHVDGIMQVATRCLRAFDSPFEIGKTSADGTEEVALSISIGAKTTDERRPGLTTFDSLLRDADIALGQAKRLGRAQAVMFSDDLRGRSADRVLIETDLRKTLANHELTAQYQPIIDLSTGSTYGAEALVRWNHPERGPISPGYFISVAEESALIGQVDAWVLNEALTRAAGWTKQEGSPRIVSVNVSDRQLAAGNLTKEVARVLGETGTDPQLLCFEFPESVLMNDLDTTVRSLHNLHGLGVHLAIDHFGTGHLSLSSLRELPIDIVKIDRTFVHSLRVGGKDNAMAAAVINLAHTLGVKTLASGVETEDQQRVLVELGCDLAQGYWFSPPLPADQLTQKLIGYRKSLLRNDA